MHLGLEMSVGKFSGYSEYLGNVAKPIPKSICATECTSPTQSRSLSPAVSSSPNPVTFRLTSSQLPEQHTEMRGPRATHTHCKMLEPSGQPSSLEPAAVASSQHPALTPCGIAAKPSTQSECELEDCYERHPAAAGANLLMRAHDTPLVCVLV